MTSASKLYVIVKNTLSAGLKAAQACHALKAFGIAYPDIDREWYEASNNIVVLEHDDLPTLADRLTNHGFALARFHEPDQNGALTAFCVEPEARRKVSALSLAS